MRIKVLLFTAFLVLLTLSITSCQQEAPAIGSPAPDFNLSNLEGETISLSEYRGQPVILNFWALSCPYCKLEMPFIEQAWDTYGNNAQGLMVFTINIRDSSSSINSYLESEGYTFTVLRDEGARAAGKYQVNGIPVTVFIDKNGIIQDIVTGAFPNWPSLENRLSKIIK